MEDYVAASFRPMKRGMKTVKQPLQVKQPFDHCAIFHLKKKRLPALESFLRSAYIRKFMVHDLGWGFPKWKGIWGHVRSAAEYLSANIIINYGAYPSVY